MNFLQCEYEKYLSNTDYTTIHKSLTIQVAEWINVGGKYKVFEAK